MAEAADLSCPEADPGTKARASERHMFTGQQVVGGSGRATSQRIKCTLSESDLISVECKGRTLRTNFKSLSGIFFRFLLLSLVYFILDLGSNCSFNSKE